jgi:excisionase family DNA binding protein
VSAVNGAEWLTAREAAELLRVNYRTVLDAVHAGELPAVRVGRAVRISRRALQRAAVGLGPGRAAAPDAEPGTVLDPAARDDNGGRHAR